MLDSYEEVTSTLKSLDDCYYLKSNFLILFVIFSIIGIKLRESIYDNYSKNCLIITNFNYNK